MTNSDTHEHAYDASGSPWQPGRPVLPGVSRRRFLQYTGLGAAAVAASGIGAGSASAAVSSPAAKTLPKGWSGTISDVKHVVILMQENRSFDHYFGTLRGVRGYGDKQALSYPNGTSIFAQPDKSRTDLGYLLPYNLTDQIDGDLDHSWVGDHEARNGGLWNNWVAAKSEETMGYFTRNEIPFQYAVADAFTICDGYHQAIMAPTSPNRMYLWTGTSSGWITNPDDYTVDFGPDAGTAEVTTYPELLQKAGVTGRFTPTTRWAIAAATPITSSATTATTRSGSTSSTTPPTAATAGPVRSRPAARSPRGRPTPGHRR